MQLIEEPPDPPATVVNGHGRQFRFMLHVIGERFDLLRAGSERSGWLLQTPNELEPSDGKRIEERRWLASLAFDLVESQAFRGRLADPSMLRDRKQTRAVRPQGAPGVALIRKMCQEGKTFFQQGT